jgi:acetyl esterase/lipase
VPFGYLITTGLMTLFVLFAVAPPRPARSSRFRLSSWLGFIVNEVPFIAFYVLAASTALAIAQGDIANPVGLIGLVLAVLATGGLVVVVLRATRTGDVVDDALAAAGLPASAPGPLPLRIFFWPFPVPQPGIERISNIAYGDAGRANMLDVYRSRSHSGAGPTLVHLHGGGFRVGRKSREARPLFHRLASRGWVCISANYRLRTQYSDALADVKELLAWVREHGPEYGADPTVAVLAGSSAGAHLASVTALTDPSVAAVVSLYGYYGPAGAERSSPMANEGAPPFFVAHPERDTLVIPADARRFVDSLRKGSANPVVYAELPGAQHGFDFFYSIRFEAVIDGIESFADDVLRRTSSPRRPPRAPGPVSGSSGSSGRDRAERR